MMLRWVMVAVLGCAACSSSINYAGLQTGPRHATYHESARTATLPNGLKVAVVPDDRGDLVTVLVRYEVGTADDPAGAAGLSHFVEHILYDAALGDARDAALVGNAVTSADRTYFFATALDSALDTELEVAARRFEVGCDAFSDEVLARERDVVIEELQLGGRIDNPDNGIYPALWGDKHPYANVGTLHQFRTASRETVCKFLADHYGPGSATLVVTGHVDPGLEQRIAARFAKLAPRPVAARPALPPAPTGDTDVVVPGLAHDLVMLAMPFSGRRALAEVLANMGLMVTGEERDRLLVAMYADEDIANRARERLKDVDLKSIDEPRRAVRNQLVAELDDQASVAGTIADQLSRGERPNRYRDLEQLDALTPDDVMRALRPGRVVRLRGDGTKPAQHTTGLGNVVHHVEVQRVSSQPPVLPTRRGAPPATDYTLANGMRVLLAPDLTAAGIDARLVIATDNLTPVWREYAQQAPRFLREPDPMSTDDGDRYGWYFRFGAPIRVTTRPGATTFAVSGASLFADWDVWYLANRVVAGDIATGASSLHHMGTLERPVAPPPSAREVALARLDELMPEVVEVHPRDHLRSFVQQSYGPRVATLIVSGRFDETAMRGEIEALFDHWRGGPPPTAGTYRPHPSTPAAVAVIAPDAQQVQLAVAFASTDNYTDRERVAREVLSSLLDDRVRVVREGLGVSYDVSTGVIHTAVLCGGSVDLAYAGDAAKALADELAHLRAGELDPADFARARNHVLAAKLAQPFGATSRANQLERRVVAKQPLDQDERDLELIRGLDLEAVKRLAIHDLAPTKMITVVRGPDIQVRAVFAALGIAKFERR